MSTGFNPNLAVLRRKALELGATIVSTREGARHTIVIMRTREGRMVQMALSRYRIERYIMEGWTRQAVMRVSRQLNPVLANDNEKSPDD